MNVKMGSIIEIKTKLGLVYAQYIARMPPYGTVLAVFERAYPQRPCNAEEVAKDDVRFPVFFPLNSALAQGFVQKLGCATVHARVELVFRFGHVDHETKKINRWFLWDGKREWEVGTITEDQRRYQLRSIWNIDLLTERIEQDWRPETDTR